MNYYQIWFDLKNNTKGREFLKNAKEFLDLLKSESLIGYYILRRKFGLAPREFGEFNIQMVMQDLKPLVQIFKLIA